MTLHVNLMNTTLTDNLGIFRIQGFGMTYFMGYHINVGRHLRQPE